MKRGRKEIATKEKRRIKRVITEKDNKNSDDSTQSINRVQHDMFVCVCVCVCSCVWENSLSEPTQIYLREYLSFSL